jgi:hypothetical protein
MLLQAVTTVWRTELGTTLLNGFNSTTDESAYFRYLVLYQSAINRQTPGECHKFLSRMAPPIGHFAFEELIPAPLDSSFYAAGFSSIGTSL